MNQKYCTAIFTGVILQWIYFQWNYLKWMNFAFRLDKRCFNNDVIFVLTCSWYSYLGCFRKVLFLLFIYWTQKNKLYSYRNKKTINVNNYTVNL